MYLRSPRSGRLPCGLAWHGAGHDEPRRRIVSESVWAGTTVICVGCRRPTSFSRARYSHRARVASSSDPRAVRAVPPAATSPEEFTL